MTPTLAFWLFFFAPIGFCSTIMLAVIGAAYFLGWVK